MTPSPSLQQHEWAAHGTCGWDSPEAYFAQAARMWDGHLPALVSYGLVITDEWIGQGRNDTVREKILVFAPEVDGVAQDDLELPAWIGDEAFHRAHRSNLIRKDAEFYVPRFGDVPDDLPYIWPV